MSLEALILSKDQEVTLAFRRVLQANSISLVVAASVKEANENLGSRKYDAVIIDCDDIAGSSSVLAEMRKGQSNRNAIAFAITNGVTTMKKAYDVGANFVLKDSLSA